MAVVILIAAAAGIYYIYSTREQEPASQPGPPEQASFDARNSTFSVDGNLVTLINGTAETPAAPGSASKTTTRYFGNEATGDLDGDGSQDIAFLVTQDGGGSGLFYYAVVALKTDDGYKTTNAYLIGDRIAPQSTNIPANSLELHVNYAERKPGEPMTAQPSVGAVRLLKVTSAGVLVGGFSDSKTSIAWRFADAGEVDGIPYTAVTVVVNGAAYEMGKFNGSCSEIGAGGGIDGKGLLAGELSAVQCWFAGGGNEVGVFAHEDGGFDIMVGELSEVEEGSGMFRGDFSVKNTIAP